MDFYQVPVIFMRVVCPHIPTLYSLLLRRCGPFEMGDWLKWALVTVVQFVIGKRFYVAAARALRNCSTNMDVLVALGTSASYFYSVYALFYGAITGFHSPTYFETSAMLITFVLLGKYLETLAKGKTSDAIKKLVELAPATALLLLQDKGIFAACNICHGHGGLHTASCYALLLYILNSNIELKCKNIM